jgi:hypothetical protein
LRAGGGADQQTDCGGHGDACKEAHRSGGARAPRKVTAHALGCFMNRADFTGFSRRVKLD